MEELGDPTDSENEGEGEGEEEAEAEAEAEDEREGEDENSDSGDTPIQLQINLTTEVEEEVDRFLESEDEQFTFEEFYCMLGPWALGRQKEVLAALKRPTGPPLRSVGLRWALKPRSRPVHYKMTRI